MKTAAERFLSYAAFPTMSDETSGTTPSSQKQFALAEYIADEMKEIGIADARVDGNCCVTGTIPATPGYESLPAIGFIAHLDTSPDSPDGPLCARTVAYEGGDVLLNEDEHIVLSEKDFPFLASYAGQHLIVTDGKTLLGADDKAGITAILTAAERLLRGNLPHGKICIGFTPDEEIGEGADHFDVASFGADYAYTVDGGRLGELEYENFNAASASVVIHGREIHPGSAKGIMKNAALIAAEFTSLLPAAEIPAATEGYEGFYHLINLAGGTAEARADYILRDHDFASFDRRKATFAAAADYLNAKYGAGTAECTIRDSYRNMREIIEQNMFIIDRARAAMLEEGVTPIVQPIRGGTDGARLSYMGLPCPNLCTGGENFHSRFEFLSVEALEKVCAIVLRIITDLAK